MRNVLRWIPALALAAVPVSAGAQGASTWTWGAIGGLNLASINADDISDKSMRLGFDLGLTTQRKVNDMWTFVGEGHWTMKGVKGKDSGVDLSAKLTYFEVPVLLRGMSATGGVKPFVEFGPVIAFKLSCDIEAKSGTTSFNTDCDAVGGKVKTTDYGLLGGAGLEWTAMGRPWTLSARYNLGLQNLNDEGSDTDAKNRNIQFLLGFRFR